MKFLKRLISIQLIISTTAYANFKGEIQFTQKEIIEHYDSTEDIADYAGNCLVEYRRSHIEFFESNCTEHEGRKICLSKYYGDQRYSPKPDEFTADGKPLAYLPTELEKYGFDPLLVEQMENMSCVGMALKCLGDGFRRTGHSKLWERILGFVKQNNVDGTALQEALRRLGWKILYWNPSKPEKILENARMWDEEEKEWPSKGYHEFRWALVKRTQMYRWNKVDDFKTLVGFGIESPAIMEWIPFWVGTAHTGYHVFPGTYRDIIEAGSTRSIIDKDIVRWSIFAPMNQAQGGGPEWYSRGKYRSGLIAIPPGFLEKATQYIWRKNL